MLTIDYCPIKHSIAVDYWLLSNQTQHRCWLLIAVPSNTASLLTIDHCPIKHSIAVDYWLLSHQTQHRCWLLIAVSTVSLLTIDCCSTHQSQHHGCTLIVVPSNTKWPRPLRGSKWELSLDEAEIISKLLLRIMWEIKFLIDYTMQGHTFELCANLTAI